MYRCKYCNTIYTDEEIESKEIEECETLLNEDAVCGCKEFEKSSDESMIKAGLGRCWRIPSKEG